MTEDSKIIDLFLARDEQAIIELSEKYGSLCTSISKNILGSVLDAEECVNDAYLAIWNSIPPENPNSLRAYLFRIVRNISIAKYHKNTAQKRNSHYDVALDELEDCLDLSDTPQREIDAAELSKQIDAFLAGLDREDRVIFVRRYWYSDRVSDISQTLGRSSGSVSTRLFRLREKLKKHLKKEGFEV